MFEETENCIEKYESIYNIIANTFNLIGFLIIIGAIIILAFSTDITEQIIIIITLIAVFLLYVLSRKIILAFIQWQKLMLSNLLFINENPLGNQKQNELKR